MAKVRGIKVIVDTKIARGGPLVAGDGQGFLSELDALLPRHSRIYKMTSSYPLNRKQSLVYELYIENVMFCQVDEGHEPEVEVVLFHHVDGTSSADRLDSLTKHVDPNTTEGATYLSTMTSTSLPVGNSTVTSAKMKPIPVFGHLKANPSPHKSASYGDTVTDAYGTPCAPAFASDEGDKDKSDGDKLKDFFFPKGKDMNDCNCGVKYLRDGGIHDEGCPMKGKDDKANWG
jgi:hypothetical protein